MSEHSMEHNTETQPTLFAADFLANRSASPEKEKAATTKDISFRKCFELYQKSDRVGSSLKMFAESLVSRMDKLSPRFTHIWKA